MKQLKGKQQKNKLLGALLAVGVVVLLMALALYGKLFMGNEKSSLKKEQKVVACICYMSEYIFFDRDGIVVESRTQRQDGVPVVEGVNFTKMNLHEQLEVEDTEIFSKIMNVSLLLSKYEIATDKIYFDNKKKVTLYIGDIRVKLGKREVYDSQISQLSKMLPKALKKKLKGEFDMENYQEGQEQIIFKKDGK